MRAIEARGDDGQFDLDNEKPAHFHCTLPLNLTSNSWMDNEREIDGSLVLHI